MCFLWGWFVFLYYILIFFFAFAIYYLLSTGKYIDDFKFVQGKEMHFGKVLEFDGVSVDQCAKLCIEEESVNCQTFAYCGNYTKCKLMSSTPKHLGPGYITSSDFCNLYISKLKLIELFMTMYKRFIMILLYAYILQQLGSVISF